MLNTISTPDFAVIVWPWHYYTCLYMYRGTQPFKYTVSTATLKLKPAVFEQPKLQMYAHDAMIFVSEFPSKATSELRAVWP